MRPRSAQFLGVAVTLPTVSKHWTVRVRVPAPHLFEHSVQMPVWKTNSGQVFSTQFSVVGSFALVHMKSSVICPSRSTSLSMVSRHLTARVLMPSPHGTLQLSKSSATHPSLVFFGSSGHDWAAVQAPVAAGLVPVHLLSSVCFTFLSSSHWIVRMREPVPQVLLHTPHVPFIHRYVVQGAVLQASLLTGVAPAAPVPIVVTCLAASSALRAAPSAWDTMRVWVVTVASVPSRVNRAVAALLAMTTARAPFS